MSDFTRSLNSISVDGDGRYVRASEVNGLFLPAPVDDNGRPWKLQGSHLGGYPLDRVVYETGPEDGLIGFLDFGEGGSVRFSDGVTEHVEQDDDSWKSLYEDVSETPAAIGLDEFVERARKLAAGGRR